MVHYWRHPCGLIEIVVELREEINYMRDLHDYITSENYSAIADAWNQERREVVDIAMEKFKKMFNRALREELRKACEDAVAFAIRQNYYKVCVSYWSFQILY
jgi:transcription elongation factor SPT6